MIHKKLLFFIYRKIAKIYILIFGRKKMQFFNDLILSLSLKGKGYMNYGTFKETGEKFFINLMPTLVLILSGWN